MGRKFWRVSSCDKKQAADIAGEYGYDEFAVLLLNSRGIKEPSQVEEFLSCRQEFSDPFLIKDMDKAVNRINKALDAGEKIAVYGDYDADGVTATSLLYMYLEAVGADVTYYIPSRLSEGYGLHREAVDSLCGQGVKLIITVDNGINSVKETEYIKAKGMDIVITDHHQPGEKLPEAAAVVDPHRADDKCPFKDLAGVGVAFKLAAALEGGDCLGILEDFGDIAAIGTIADVVPLKGENRMIAVKGAEMINNSPRQGIKALIAAASMEGKYFSSTNIAFAIAPRINAAGRIDTAEAAAELFMTDDEERAAELAARLDEYNTVRQETEADIFAEAVKIIEENDKIKYAPVITVDGEGWHSGVIGIVASKLVERYGKPAVVIAREPGEYAKGSCRSIEGFSLFDALSASSEFLVKFGGHTLAAGFTVKKESIDALRDSLNNYASRLPEFYPVLKLDCKINPLYINMGLVESLELLEPFGAENPQPLFGIYAVTLKGIKPLGLSGKHLRVMFEKAGNVYSGVYFGMSRENFPYEPGDRLDLAVTVDKNEFRGEVKPAIYIRDVKNSDFSDEDYFKSLYLYNKIKRRDRIDKEERIAACPTRNTAARVFRYIKNSGACRKSPEQIALKIGMTSRDACRVKVILDAFVELGLIKYENRCYFPAKTDKKAKLSDSELLSFLGYNE